MAPLERNLPERNLPERTTARTSNVRMVNPLSKYNFDLGSFISGIFKPGWTDGLNPIVQGLLDTLIRTGVPIAAKTMINSMSYQLGGSQMPVETSWEKSSGWAIALIVVMAVVCLLLVALVALCIWWERRVQHRKRAKKGKRRGMKGASDGVVVEDDGNQEREDAQGSERRTRSHASHRSDCDTSGYDSYSYSNSHSSSSSSSSDSDSEESDEELTMQSADAAAVEPSMQPGNPFPQEEDKFNGVHEEQEPPMPPTEMPAQYQEYAMRPQ